MAVTEYNPPYASAYSRPANTKRKGNRNNRNKVIITGDRSPNKSTGTRTINFRSAINQFICVLIIGPFH